MKYTVRIADVSARRHTGFSHASVNSMNTATIVASFPDYSAARAAARELENLGISRDAINVHSNQKTAGAGSSQHDIECESRSGFVTWWQNSFGSDEYMDDRRSYENELESGRAILRATVSDELTDSAINVLNRSGAIQVQQSEQLTEPETTAGTRSVPRGGVRVYSGNEPSVRTRRPATGMSPRRPSQTVMSGFGFTPGTGTLAGESTAGLHDQDFTPEYRQKFEQLYRTEPAFDAMSSAQEYGTRLASEARYHNRSWSDIENDVRSGWERDYPDSEWDRAKDAVRQSWENAIRGH